MSTGRDVAVSVLTQVGGKALHLGLNVVSSLAIIRSRTPEAFGEYVLVITVVTLLGLLADFGLSKLAVRDIAVAPDEESTILGTVVVARLLLAAVAAAGVQGLLAVLGASTAVHVAAAVASLLYVGQAVLGIAAAFAVRLQQQHEALVLVVGEATETAVVLVLVSVDAPLVALVAAPVFGIAVGVALAVTIAHRRFDVRLTFDARRLVPMLRAAAPLAAAGMVGVLLVRLDGLALAWLGTRSQLGVYAAASAPIEYLLIAAVVLVTVPLPLLSRAWTQGRAAFRGLYRTSTEVIAVVLLPVPIMVAVLAEPVVRLAYGSAYSSAAVPLRVLGWALVAMVLCAWQAYVLLSAGWQWVTLAYNLTGLALGMTLNVVLIPRAGVLGAAIATLLTTGTIAALATLLSARLAGATLAVGRLLRIIVAVAGLAAVTASLQRLGAPAAVAVIGGLGAYPLCLVWLGVVHPADIRRALERPETALPAI